MNSEQSKPVLLTDKKKGDIYEYHGTEAEKVKLSNLTTGSDPGLIAPDTVKQHLGISVHLNQLANDNPAILEAIKALNLGVIL